MKLMYKYIIYTENLEFNEYLDFEDEVEEFEFDLLKSGYEFIRVF